MSEIYSTDIFGKVTKGIPSRSKIAIIWKRICDDTMTDEFKRKMCAFYPLFSDNTDIRDKYNSILYSTGNSETSDIKINKALKYIEDTI